MVSPAQGTFTLTGFNEPLPESMAGLPGTAIVTLAEGASPDILPGNEVNRLGLVCSGTTISASVNGVELASVEDGSSATGSLSLRVNASGSGGEARFGDLLVTEPLSSDAA